MALRVVLSDKFGTGNVILLDDGGFSSVRTSLSHHCAGRCPPTGRVVRRLCLFALGAFSVGPGFIGNHVGKSFLHFRVVSVPL